MTAKEVCVWGGGLELRSLVHVHKVGVDVSQLDVFTCSEKLVCIEYLREGEADCFLCEVIPFTTVKGILCV